LEMFSGKSTADRPKKSFDQAISSLEKGGEIVLNGGFLWIPKKEGKMG
jgi:preprotein translocase subunit YajC